MTVMMMLGVKTTMMTRTQTANMKVTISRHAAGQTVRGMLGS